MAQTSSIFLFIHHFDVIYLSLSKADINKKKQYKLPLTGLCTVFIMTLSALLFSYDFFDALQAFFDLPRTLHCTSEA